MGEVIQWYNRWRRPESSESDIEKLVKDCKSMKHRVHATFPNKGGRPGPFPTADLELRSESSDSDNDDDSVSGDDVPDDVDVGGGAEKRHVKPWRFPKWEALNHLPMQKVWFGMMENQSAQCVKQSHVVVKNDMVMTNQNTTTFKQIMNLWLRHNGIGIMVNSSMRKLLARELKQLKKGIHKPLCLKERFEWPVWAPPSLNDTPKDIARYKEAVQMTHSRANVESLIRFTRESDPLVYPLQAVMVGWLDCTLCLKHPHERCTFIEELLTQRSKIRVSSQYLKFLPHHLGRFLILEENTFLGHEKSDGKDLDADELRDCWRKHVVQPRQGGFGSDSRFHGQLQFFCCLTINHPNITGTTKVLA